MPDRWEIDVEFVEQGDIYFFFKPKKSVEKAKGIGDVARFFFVLVPENEGSPRYIVMGNKKMPGFSDGGRTNWGFVQMVGGRGFETFKDQNKTPKGTSRPAGEGIYAIATHRDHAHLLYQLELPKKVGEVQKAFNIEKEVNYIFFERPVETVPKNADTPYSNFTPATVENLNKRGTEILLVGVGVDIGRLGIRANKDFESMNSADIFNKLKVNKQRHPIDALEMGKWS